MQFDKPVESIVITYSSRDHECVLVDEGTSCSVEVQGDHQNGGTQMDLGAYVRFGSTDGCLPGLVSAVISSLKDLQSLHEVCGNVQNFEVNPVK